MATATKKATSFDVKCPFCHSDDETVTIDLNDLDEIRCVACDVTFSAAEAVEEAAEAMRKWERVARWVELARQAMEG